VRLRMNRLQKLSHVRKSAETRAPTRELSPAAFVASLQRDARFGRNTALLTVLASGGEQYLNFSFKFLKRANGLPSPGLHRCKTTNPCSHATGGKK
jgi:hypothetical protein